MDRVGIIEEIWRYPVKSMAGDRLTSARIFESGIVGDRLWTVRDETKGEITGGKKIPEIMTLRASYVHEPHQDGPVPPVEIAFPDGRTVRSDVPSVEADLSGFLGRRVSLSPVRPASEKEHYKLARPAKASDVRRQLGVGDEEPDPDLSALPLHKLLELRVYATPPGTYFDAYPLHLLTTASLRSLEREVPLADVDRRRFRPNVLIQTEAADAFPEFAWCGGTLAIGQVVLRCLAKTIRCSMPAHAQADLDRDHEILRAVRDRADRHLGVYAEVLRPGLIRTGDVVYVEQSNPLGLQRMSRRVRSLLRRTVLSVLKEA